MSPADVLPIQSVEVSSRVLATSVGQTCRHSVILNDILLTQCQH